MACYRSFKFWIDYIRSAERIKKRRRCHRCAGNTRNGGFGPTCRRSTGGRLAAFSSSVVVIILIQENTRLRGVKAGRGQSQISVQEITNRIQNPKNREA